MTLRTNLAAMGLGFCLLTLLGCNPAAKEDKKSTVANARPAEAIPAPVAFLAVAG